MNRRKPLPGLTAGLAVVEFGGHITQLDHIRKIFEEAADLRFYFRYPFDNDWSENFQKTESKTFFVTDASRRKILPTLLFYWKVWSGTRSHNLILIATGPEQKRLADMAYFLLLFLTRRSRMILNVRKASRWLRPSGLQGLSPSMLLREAIVSRIPRLLFETHAIRENFRASRPGIDSLLGVMPTKVSDYFEIGAPLPQLSGSLHIGLTGGVDTSRRDYSEISAALGSLPQGIREKITLVILGNTLRPEAAAVIDELRSHVQVTLGSSFLGLDEEQNLAARCSILISPLKPHLLRGVVDGSGSFGDAISHGLNVLMPEGCDPSGEFSGIVIEYRGTDHLAHEILLRARMHLSGGIHDDVLAKYRSPSVLASISADLNL